MAGLEPGQVMKVIGQKVEMKVIARAESGDELSDEDDSDEDEITHAVPFKCIAAAHEKNYQHHFGTGIPCSSLARAIAFNGLK